MAEINSMVKGLIIGIVSIVILFLLVGSLAGTLQDAADNISGSGLPLAGLFARGGVVILLFVVGILLGAIALSLNLFKGKK